MNFQKTQQLSEEIKKAKSVALFLGKDYDEKDALAREVLGEVFHLNNIPVYFFPETPKDTKDKWSSILPSRQKDGLVYHTLIHIPKTSFSIKDIGYENDDKFFTLNLGTNGGHIGKKDVFFESRSTEVDFAFYFGEENSGEEVGIFTNKEKTLSIKKENGSVTEGVSKIIQAIKTKTLTDTTIPTLLYASLLLETNNLDEKTKPDLLILAGNLLKMGADKNKINNIIGKKQPILFPQLLGRALARTQTNEDLKSTWTFVSKSDLEKTGSIAAEISIFQQILSSVRDYLPSQPVNVIFWQNKENEIWGLVSPRENQEDFLKKISLLMTGKVENGNYHIGPFPNFSGAEIRTQEALKEIL